MAVVYTSQSIQIDKHFAIPKGTELKSVGDHEYLLMHVNPRLSEHIRKKNPDWGRCEGALTFVTFKKPEQEAMLVDHYVKKTAGQKRKERRDRSARASDAAGATATGAAELVLSCHVDLLL